MDARPEVSHPVVEWIESGAARRIAAWAGSRTGVRPEDLDDLAQEVAQALIALGADRIINSTFVYRTSFHKAIDNRRARTLEQTADPSPRRESNAELVSLLHARVASLPLPIRRFFTLRYERGLSMIEVASELRISLGQVRTLQHSLARSL